MIFQIAPLIWGPRPESNSSDPYNNRGYLGSDKADLHTNNTCADPEGGGAGGPDPPEISKNIGFLRNTGPNSLQNHKATKPAFNVGPSSARQRNAIFSGIWIHSLKSWTPYKKKRFGSAHATKRYTSLRICSVCSVPLLFAFCHKVIQFSC